MKPIMITKLKIISITNIITLQRTISPKSIRKTRRIKSLRNVNIEKGMI